MRSHGWRQLRTANSKGTSVATSRSTALKRNAFSVFFGTMTQTLTLIWLYILVAGAPASAIRDGVVATLMHAAGMLRRQLAPG